MAEPPGHISTEDVQHCIEGTCRCDEVATLRARVAELTEERDRDLSYLISCPWCAEKMEKGPISHQIGHLIRHGDELQSRLTQLEGALRRIADAADKCAEGEYLIPGWVAKTARAALTPVVKQEKP